MSSSYLGVDHEPAWIESLIALIEPGGVKT